MRTILILQVRLDSSRLPRKALLPLAGKPLCQRVMEALSLIPATAYVLATDSCSSDDLAPLAAHCGFQLFVGPKEDVLARYAQAARAFEADQVLRATGDNPLVSFELGRLLLERRESIPADYSGYLGMPLGMGLELIEVQALYRAEREATSAFDREHVCPYLYGNPALFRIDRPQAPDEYQLPDGSLTVDTAQDYQRISRIFDELYRGAPIAAHESISWLKAEAGHG